MVPCVSKRDALPLPVEEYLDNECSHIQAVNEDIPVHIPIANYHDVPMHDVNIISLLFTGLEER